MSKPLDRLTLLETYVRICERGSISAAARDLGLSQPSASRQLAELEDRLGTQLIRRTTHELAITPAGQDLLADARQMIDGWEGLAERHGGSTREIAGRLKVVAPVGLGQSHLADIMLAFQARHPGVSLIWELEDTPVRFAESGCDCWIKVGPVPDDTLIVKPLAQIERLVVASTSLIAGRKIEAPADVEALPFAALEPFEGGRIALTSDSGRTRTITPQVAVATNNIFVLQRATLTGMQAAVLPKWFVADDLKTGLLVDTLPGWRAAALTLNIAYLPGRHRPKRLEAFLAFMEAEITNISGLAPLDARAQ